MRYVTKNIYFIKLQQQKATIKYIVKISLMVIDI